MEEIESIGSALHIKDRSLEDLERWASLATATAAIAFGLSRRSLPGMCLALAATPLAYRGLSGMHRYMPLLLDRIERGDIDPSFIITHRVTLDDAPHMCNTFREKQDGCIKVVMKPGERTSSPTPRSH